MGKILATITVFLFATLLQSTSAQSYTLPVLHIDTEGGRAITSKTIYVPGTYYIDDPTGMGFAAGTKASPLPLEIRGRGNSSWRGQKKPYKLRLGKKREMLGMAKNKHWVLLNFSDITIAGMELGRLMGMAWNPHAKPVEVVLNGDYIGLYLLSENNRISKNRIDIYKQPDNNNDNETIPYGWLVEVDNYYGPDQIVFRENNAWNMNITYHSPDTLSAKQYDWLLGEFKSINAAIYTSDKQHSTWEKYVDVEAMARFFIVQEVMDNPDGFHGSFFLYKDMGEDARWVAGPLWDLNCMQRAKTDYTFRMKVSYGFTPHWIGELLKDEDFCLAVREAWAEFYPSKVEEWMEYIDANVLPAEQAYANNHKRWSSGSPFVPLPERLASLKNSLRANMEWFNAHLPGNPASGLKDTTVCNSRYVVYNLSGIKLLEADTYEDAVRGLAKGVYIINGKKVLIH